MASAAYLQEVCIRVKSVAGRPRLWSGGVQLSRRQPSASTLPQCAIVCHLLCATPVSSWICSCCSWRLICLNSNCTPPGAVVAFCDVGAVYKCHDLLTYLLKIHNSSLNTTHSAHNLGFKFDEHLSFSIQISALSKSCYYHIQQRHCIRPYLDSTTACTTATSTVHSKLDYCNSFYYNLPKSQITRLQQIQNSLTRAVVKAPKSHHITPILHSLLFTGSK